MALSLLFLTITFKWYKDEESPSLTTKISLITSFIFCASLLPFSLIYLRVLRAKTQTILTLDKFYMLPLEEIIALFLIGELTYGFNPEIIFLVIIGPTIAFLSIIYLLYNSKKKKSKKYQIHLLFLSAAFLIILIDYRILKLFMEGLPFNEERLWVFRELLAAPFVALTLYTATSSLKTLLKRASKKPPKGVFHRSATLLFIGLLFTLYALFPLFLGGWLTASLRAAYPRIAPLQTTWYEMEAVKNIEEKTNKRYVVIGDIWTIFAGERIVGINNPRAYYFMEFNKTGRDLFSNMVQDPSPHWMLLAMNYTDTEVAYFIVSKPRLSEEKFNNTILKAQKTLEIFSVHGGGKLYVFQHEREESV
jgi:hypothetical protein